jgi:hypothetical protein
MLTGRTNAGHNRAHLKILCEVAPSLRLYGFRELENIQSPTFLSAHTGLDDYAVSFIPSAIAITQNGLPKASKGSSFLFRLMRRIV